MAQIASAHRFLSDIARLILPDIFPCYHLATSLIFMVGAVKAATVTLVREAALTIELSVSAPIELLLAWTPRLTPVVTITVKFPVKALLLALPVVVVLSITLWSSGNAIYAAAIAAAAVVVIVVANRSGLMCLDLRHPSRVGLLELAEHILHLFDYMFEHCDVFQLKRDECVVGSMDTAAIKHGIDISSSRVEMANLRGQRACKGCIVQLRGNEVDVGLSFLRIQS